MHEFRRAVIGTITSHMKAGLELSGACLPPSSMTQTNKVHFHERMSTLLPLLHVLELLLPVNPHPLPQPQGKYVESHLYFLTCVGMNFTCAYFGFIAQKPIRINLLLSWMVKRECLGHWTMFGASMSTFFCVLFIEEST